jgi:hypothetical protein
MSGYFWVDCFACTSTSVARSLRSAGVKIVCFYLANGGFVANTYNKTAFQVFTKQGWGFLPTFSGYRPGEARLNEDPNDRYVCNVATKLDGALGASQGRQAANRMSDVGFASGSLIYLDLETGDRCEGDYLDYVATWMTTVRSLGYEAAIYCPSGAVPSVSKLPWRKTPIIWLAKPDNASNQIVVDLGSPLPTFQVPTGIVAIQFATGMGGQGNEFRKNGHAIGHFDCTISLVPNPADFSSLDATAVPDIPVQDYMPFETRQFAVNELEADAVSRVAQIARTIDDDPINQTLNELRDDGITGDEDSKIGALDSQEFVRIITDVNSAGENVYANPSPARIAGWIQIKLLLLGVETEALSDITSDIVAHYPSETAQALNLIPLASRTVALGRIPELRMQAEVLERLRVSSASVIQYAAPRAVVAQLKFNGTSAVTIVSGYKMAIGELTVPDAAGSLHTFKINTGGYGSSYKFTNGPTPPGTYTVTGPFPPDPKGMTRDGVGFKFKLQPYYVQIPGGDQRGLFCIHPDGAPTGTLGCLGIAEAAPALTQCRDLITALTSSGTVEVVVEYGEGVLF